MFPDMLTRAFSAVTGSTFLLHSEERSFAVTSVVLALIPAF